MTRPRQFGVRSPAACTPTYGEKLESRHCLSSIALIEHDAIEIAGDTRYLAGVTTHIADVDGDADLDVIVSSMNPLMNEDERYDNAWYENVGGSGNFLQRHAIPTLSGFVESLSSGDLDGDGDQDLLSAAYDGEFIAWLENEDGAGRFGTEQVIEAHPSIHDSHYIGTADVDSDGDLDVVSAWSLTSRMLVGSSANWYPVEHEQAFGLRQGIIEDKTADYIYDLQPVDVDHDDDVDFVFVKEFQRTGEGVGGVYWIENDEGVFWEEQLIAPIVGRLVAVDIDNDANVDVVVAGESLWWVPNGDRLSNDPRRIDTLEEDTLAIKAGDFDLDGDADLIVHTAVSEGDDRWTFSISWYRNLDSSGSFADAQLIFRTNDPITTSFQFDYHTRALVDTMHLGDIDGDRQTDVVVSLPNKVTWYETRLIGDSNNDGAFNSSDLVAVFQAGKYEDGIDDNTSFDEGDWNQNGDFDSSDFVAAFKAGHYVAAALPLNAEIAATVEAVLDETDRERAKAFVS